MSSNAIDNYKNTKNDDFNNNNRGEEKNYDYNGVYDGYGTDLSIYKMEEIFFFADQVDLGSLAFVSKHESQDSL